MKLPLKTHTITRILEGTQTKLLLPKYMFDRVLNDVGKTWVDIRAPFIIDDGKLIYRADFGPSREYDWNPGTFMKKEQVRLKVKLGTFHLIPIQDLTIDEIKCLGLQSKEELIREWNRDLPKVKRQEFVYKKNPCFYLVSMEVQHEQ